MQSPTPAENTSAYLVKIAADALEQLELEKIKAYRMVYLDFLDDDREYTSSIEPSTQLSELEGRTCAVCAKGALILGHLRQGPPEAEVGYHDARIDELDEIFGVEKLDLVEACFEGFHGSGPIAHRYYRHYPESEDRLRAILANIVRNEGEFVPEQDL